MYKLHTACRACGFPGAQGPGGTKSAGSADKLIPVLDLGVQPMANDFRKPGEEHAGYAPLKVLFCPRCSLAQLSVVVRPDILYSNYSFVTSPSHTMREHFEALVLDLGTEQKPGGVVEIGSNDGLFLGFLGQHGYGNLVGIDPAKNLVPAARKAGAITVNDVFNANSAKLAREAVGTADLVMARHCFCHIDDWRGFIAALDVLSSRETLICIEVPYVVDQLNCGSFDQVYHEHLSYMPIKAMKALLNGTNFHLHRVCHYPIHGGCILMMIRRNDSLTPAHPSVANYLETEEVTLDQWQTFAKNAFRNITELRTTVKDLVAQGKRICGWGASAKSTVWVNACGFTRREIAFIMDATAQKVYTTTPGSDIPIGQEGEHYTGCFDYVVLFAWNYADEIMSRERKFGHSGFKWIIPVPTVQICDAL